MYYSTSPVIASPVLESLGFFRRIIDILIVQNSRDKETVKSISLKLPLRSTDIITLLFGHDMAKLQTLKSHSDSARPAINKKYRFKPLRYGSGKPNGEAA